MTVYVDDMRWPATVGRVRGVWSHLMADTSEELHEFAAQLGLRRAWVQHEGRPTEHYDITDPKRQQALKLGAVPIVYITEGGRLTQAKRAGVPFDLEKVRAELAERTWEVADEQLRLI